MLSNERAKETSYDTLYGIHKQLQTDSILRYFISDNEIYNSIKYLRDTYWNSWTCLHNSNDQIHYSTNQRESIVWEKYYLTYNPDSNFYCWVYNFAWLVVLYPLPFPLPKTSSTVFLVSTRIPYISLQKEWQ